MTLHNNMERLETKAKELLSEMHVDFTPVIEGVEIVDVGFYSRKSGDNSYIVELTGGNSKVAAYYLSLLLHQHGWYGVVVLAGDIWASSYHSPPSAANDAAP